MCISSFILSHFVDCAISICFTCRFSAPCTAVLLFSKRDCVFFTKRRKIFDKISKIPRFYEKSMTFSIFICCLDSQPRRVSPTILRVGSFLFGHESGHSIAHPSGQSSEKLLTRIPQSSHSKKSPCRYVSAEGLSSSVISPKCAYRAATAAFSSSTRSVFSHFTPRSSRPIWP